MSQSQPELEVDGLEDFKLEDPKEVKPISPEALGRKSGEVNESGEVHTFSKLEKEVVRNLDVQVEEIASKLMATPVHSKEYKDITAALNRMGDAEVTKTTNLSSQMLNRRSVRSMKENDYGQGGEVAKDLTKLRQKVVDLDPSRRDKLFSKERWLGMKLPFGIGRKVDNYFQEYKTAQTQLDDIITGLRNGKEALQMDNAYIDEDKEQMHTLMVKLEQYAYVMKKIDQRIESRLPEIEAEDKMKAEDIKQEILFPVRQKRLDILQHLAVSMQGYMALQVIKKNNQELIRGVDRATKTTVAALRTAIVVSEALGTQKLVLDQINAVNEVTNHLIESTSEQLGRQGLEIQRQATESAVNVQTLEKAFQNIFKAMDEMDRYRLEGLPKMQKTLESLEKTVDNAKNYLSSRREERIGDFAAEVLSDKKPAEDDKIIKIRP